MYLFCNFSTTSRVCKEFKKKDSQFAHRISILPSFVCTLIVVLPKKGLEVRGERKGSGLVEERVSRDYRNRRKSGKGRRRCHCRWHIVPELCYHRSILGIVLALPRERRSGGAVWPHCTTRSPRWRRRSTKPGHLRA